MYKFLKGRPKLQLKPLMFICLSVLASVNCFASPEAERAQGLLKAMRLDDAFKSATNSKEARDCVDREFSDHSPKLVKILTERFSLGEIEHLRLFLESSTGKRWTQRNLARNSNMDPRQPKQIVPDYQGNELEELTLFLGSPVGKKYMRESAEGPFSRLLISTGVAIGYACYPYRAK